MMMMLMTSQISVQTAVQDTLCCLFLFHPLLITSPEWSQMNFFLLFTTSRVTFRQCQVMCYIKISTRQSNLVMFFFFMFHLMHYEINLSTTFKALKDFHLLL